MRLHSLRFAALGPFAGEEAIDFNALAQSGIFLFEGPTGSGKSSIIDAIVFALYGVIADADNKAKERMRSDFAAPDTVSYVDLVFETNRGVFRVRRTPSYERPKQRGGGTTTQNATAQLWRLSTADLDTVAELNAKQPGGSHDELDVRGELISHRASEVGSEVEHIVGLNRKQFVQTIVLPQGLFAQFLTARAEDRSTILRKVFRAEIYVQFEEMLRKKSAAKTSQIRSAKEAADIARHSLAKAIGPDESGPLADQLATLQHAALTTTVGDGGEDLSTVAAQITQLFTTSREGAYTQWQTAKQRRSEADEALREARQLMKLGEQRDSARQRLADLGQAQPHIDELRDKIAAHHRATVVEVARNRHKNALSSQTNLEQQLATTRETAVATQLELPDDIDDKILRSKRDAALEAHHQIVAAKAAWQKVEQLNERHEKTRSLVAACAAQEAEVKSQAVDLPVQLQNLDEQLAELADAETNLVRAEHTVRESQHHQDTTQRLTGLIAQWHIAVTTLATKAEHAAQLVVRAKDLQLSRLANMSAELAAELNSGQPCPVCGSIEHPDPARPGPAAVTAADVTLVETERDAAIATASAHESEVISLRQQCVVLLEALQKAFAPATTLLTLISPSATTANPGTYVNEIDELVDQLTTEVAVQHQTAEAVNKTAKAAVVRLHKLREDHEAISTLMKSLEKEQHEATLRAATLAAELVEIGTQYDAALSEAQSYLTELTDTSEPKAAQKLLHQHEELTQKQLGAIEQLDSAWAEWQQARHTAEDLHATLLVVVSEQGFASLSEATAALLPEETVAAFLRETTDHDEQVTGAQTILQLPDIVRLPEVVKFDLTKLSETVQVAEKAEQEAQTRHTEQVALASRVESAAGNVISAVSDYESLLDSSAALVRLAELVSGTASDNRVRMTLSTYVLVQRFEAVVDAANMRLENLSNGRYHLERTEEREKAQDRRVGLALQIVDNESEKARPTRSLSGGETFYVSLCLALGLADVVMSESGARDFGTLIIDEGFGTLDAEKLETVLHELAKLHTDGRTIGVVSHVEALKTVIAEQIQVRPASPNGSTVHVVS